MGPNMGPLQCKNTVPVQLPQEFEVKIESCDGSHVFRAPSGLEYHCIVATKAGWWFLQPRMTMQRTLKLYKLDKKPSTVGLRPMLLTDVSQVLFHSPPHPTFTP